MSQPHSEIFAPHTTEHYLGTLGLGLEHLAEHVRGVGAPSTGASVGSVAALVDQVDLGRPLGDVKAALAELSEVYLDDAVWFHDPAYVAHLNCPIVIPALLAELYVSAVNSSLDTWDQSIGGTLIERRLIDWTTGRIGYGEGADGVFTSGGTQSNLQALLIARGETGAERHRLRIFASVDAHFSVQKSAMVLGLGPESVVGVPVDPVHRRLDPLALARELDGARRFGLVPMAVVATAGTTDFGAIDPLVAIAAVCAEHDVRLHVDAAFGGGLLASGRRRHLLAGIELADSVTVDYHKTFFQPVSSSALLVRDGASLRHVTHHADYLNPAPQQGAAAVPNQVDKSLQTTRRFDALKLWLTLRIMGADQVGRIFDDAIDLAHGLHRRLQGDAAIEVAATPTLSTLVFRYRPTGMSARRSAELVPRIRARIFDSGEAVIAGTKVDGEAWLKMTLLNPTATDDDLDRVIDLVRTHGAVLDAEAPALPVVPEQPSARFREAVAR